MNEHCTILSPAAAGAHAMAAPEHARTRLAGKVISFIDNTKPNFDLLADDMASLLMEQHGAARIVRHRKRAPSDGASVEMLQEIEENCDLVIAGSGD